MFTLPPFPVLRRRALVASGGALIATVGIAAAGSAATVEVAVDGEVHDVRAFGGTVGDVLDRLEIVIGPADEISLDPQTPVGDDLSVDVTRAITVGIELHGVVARRITAPVSTVAGVFEAAAMGDIRATGAEIDPGWDAAVHDGDTITVDLPTEVTVVVDGEEHHTATMADTIGAVLDEAGVELGPDDLVSPWGSGPLLGPMRITVQRVEVAEVTVEVVLEHDEQRRETDDLERGATRVEREGEAGLRIDTYEVTVVDGEEVDRERIAEAVVAEPQDRILLVGTKAPPPPNSSAVGSSVWDRLARCESNGDWSAISGNGMYYGGLQFHPSTWRSVGGTGMPHEASKAEQIERGRILQQRSGWGQWPACSRRLGLTD